MIRSSKFAPALFSALLSLGAATTATAQQPGITDTEIKFGNIMPYSGPASALSVTGKAFAAYFDLINEKGGVNGRKLNMISLDDGFSPPTSLAARFGSGGSGAPVAATAGASGDGGSAATDVGASVGENSSTRRGCSMKISPA